MLVGEWMYTTKNPIKNQWMRATYPALEAFVVVNPCAVNDFHSNLATGLHLCGLPDGAFGA